MPTIHLETIIEAPLILVFDLTRDISLHMASVPGTQEKAIAGRMSGPVEMGDLVTFEAVHFGIKQRLTSKITEYGAPFYFTDEMQKGAFKSLRHKHSFKALSETRTLMMDNLHFESPLGVLGQLANRLVLTNYMRRFLLERNANLKKLIESGEWKAIVKKQASY